MVRIRYLFNRIGNKFRNYFRLIILCLILYLLKYNSDNSSVQLNILLLSYIFIYKDYIKHNFSYSINKIFNIMYDNYIKEFHHLYVKFEDYIFFLNQLKLLRFNIKENRDRIRDELESLMASKRFPIDLYTRAPDYYFLNLDHNYISKLINNLVSVIDVADRYLESNAEYLNTQSAKMNDAVVNFRNIKENMLKILNVSVSNYSNYGVYNRDTFEHNFCLIWHNKHDDSIGEQEKSTGGCCWWDGTFLEEPLS